MLMNKIKSLFHKPIKLSKWDSAVLLAIKGHDIKGIYRFPRENPLDYLQRVCNVYCGFSKNGYVNDEIHADMFTICLSIAGEILTKHEVMGVLLRGNGSEPNALMYSLYFTMRHAMVINVRENKLLIDLDEELIERTI